MSKVKIQIVCRKKGKLTQGVIIIKMHRIIHVVHFYPLLLCKPPNNTCIKPTILSTSKKYTTFGITTQKSIEVGYIAKKVMETPRHTLVILMQDSCLILCMIATPRQFALCNKQRSDNWYIILLGLWIWILNEIR